MGVLSIYGMHFSFKGHTIDIDVKHSINNDKTDKGPKIC